MRRKPVSEWTMDELKEILKRVRMALGEEDYKVMNAVVETLSYLTHLAKDKQAAEIYRILGSSKSEKTRRREKLWASANGKCWVRRLVPCACIRHQSRHWASPPFSLFTFSFAIRNPGREMRQSSRRRWGSYTRG